MFSNTQGGRKKVSRETNKKQSTNRTQKITQKIPAIQKF